MKLEYLFLDDTFKATLEGYHPENVIISYHQLNESACWMVVIAANGENEASANRLSAVNDHIMEALKPTVLRNDFSAYYNCKLYPLFNAFERKLRKLLYLKINIVKDEKTAENLQALEEKSFGELFDLLFTDGEFMKQARTLINEKNIRFTKKQILEKMQEIAENTLWGKLLGNDTIPALCENFVEVRMLRNDVMHAHNIGQSKYRRAKKILKEINKEIDDEFNRILQLPETAMSVEFNDALNTAIKQMREQSRILRESYIAATNAYILQRNSDICETVHKLAQLVKTMYATEDMQSQVKDIRMCMSDNMHELKKNLDSSTIESSRNQIQQMIEGQKESIQQLSSQLTSEIADGEHFILPNIEEEDNNGENEV